MIRRFKKLIKKQWSSFATGSIPRSYRAAAFSIVFGVFGVTLALATHAASPTSSVEPETGTLAGSASVVTDSTASGGQDIKFGSCANPTVSAILVPSCGVWLGGYANGYGQVNFKLKIQDHETRIGRQLSFVHSFHPSTDTALSSNDVFFATRANTYLFTNWKPADVWADAGGSNSTVNAHIDTFANSIKAVAPHKVMLTINHEPENDVSSGASGCAGNVYAGSATAGTPADYRAMWANVRARFDALNVTNVVWAVDYMSDTKYNCMKQDLWPGNNLVDWVLYNQYPTDGETWLGAMGEMYNWLTANSDTTHDFLSKPWGIGEWGSQYSTQADAYQLYDDGAAAIAAGDLPKLKLYTVFDSTGTGDSRVGYDNSGQLDPVEQQHYNAFAASSGFIVP